MTTYAATAAFTFSAEIEATTEETAATPMTVTLVEVREPLWIQLTEISN